MRIQPFFLFVLSFMLLQSCAHQDRKYSFLQTGNQLARDGLYHEAADNYRKELKTSPNSAQAHRNLGIVSIKLTDYDTAIQHLEIAVPSYSDNFDTNYYLGEAFRAKNRFDDAIFRYKKALEKRPEEPRALKALAWSYFKIRYYSQAIVTGKRLIKAHPEDPQAHIIQARTLIKLKRADAALVSTRNAVKVAQKRWVPYIRSVQGDAYFALKNYRKAQKSYRTALKGQPLLAGALLGMGRCLAKSGDLKEAATFMKRALKVRPRLTEGYFALAQVYEKLDPKRAVDYYRFFGKKAATDPEFLGILEDIEKRIGIITARGLGQKQNSL